MTSYLLVVNPISGGGRGRTRALALRDMLSVSDDVDVYETQGRGMATAVAAEGVGRFDRVIAIGGDGTLNEVLTGLFRANVPSVDRPVLGFLPSGTANVAVRAFGFAADVDALVRSLPEARATPVDVGVVKHEGAERPFLLWFGAGFDAVVIDALNRSRTGRMGMAGLLRSTPRVVAALGRYRAPEIEIESGGERVGGASSVVLANVAPIAFGGRVVNDADAADGRLDLVVMPAVSRWKLVTPAFRMLTSSHAPAKGARHRLVSRVQLTSDGAVPFQLDGEPVGWLPADVRVEPGAVRLLLPGGKSTPR